jgi:long-chain acyl-CoA synthetase
MQKELSIEIGEALPGEGCIRRSILSPGELVTSPAPGVNTIYDILQHSVKTYGEAKPCIGYRKVLAVIEEEKEVHKPDGSIEKKMWKYFQLSGYNWLNFSEVSELAKTIGSGLFELGMRKNARLEIFANTRYRRSLCVLSQSSPLLTPMSLL